MWKYNICKVVYSPCTLKLMDGSTINVASAILDNDRIRGTDDYRMHVEGRWADPPSISDIIDDEIMSAARYIINQGIEWDSPMADRILTDRCHSILDHHGNYHSISRLYHVISTDLNMRSIYIDWYMTRVGRSIPISNRIPVSEMMPVHTTRRPIYRMGTSDPIGYTSGR